MRTSIQDRARHDKHDNGNIAPGTATAEVTATTNAVTAAHGMSRRPCHRLDWLKLTGAAILLVAAIIHSAHAFQPAQAQHTISWQPPQSQSSCRRRRQSIVPLPVIRVGPINGNNPYNLKGSFCRRMATRATPLASSSYGKFGQENSEDEEDDDDYDDEEEDDDDDDYDDLDDRAVQDFRTRMSTLFDANKADDDESIADELLQISAIGSSAELQTPLEWARPVAVESIRAGCILVANPRAFCSDFENEPNQPQQQQQQRRSSPSPQLLSKFGLTLPPPADLGADRRADLLPVLVVTEYDSKTTAAKAVLLNRRTGYLLGDLEQPESPSSSTPKPILEKFCIQPLWFGGVDTSINSNSAGLDMLHQCPTVPGSQQITEDGLYWGGDPAQAQDALDNQQPQQQNRILTGFDFKFFVQATNFPPGELQRELNAGTFFVCNVAKEILFKSRDRMGTRRAKPLWTEIMELMGGDYRQVRDRLYGVDDDEENDDMRSGGGFGLLQ